MHLPWDGDGAIRMGGAAGRKESYYQTLIKNAMCLARALVQNVRLYLALLFTTPRPFFKNNVLSFFTRSGVP